MAETIDILRSWKEIAAHLGKGVRTVQRWEQAEGLPVHRHEHQERSSVYAYRAEIDDWWASRRRSLESEPAPAPAPLPALPPDRRRLRWASVAAVFAAALLLAWIQTSSTRAIESQFTQITNDGRQKYSNFYSWSMPIVTDGARVFFTAALPGGYGIFHASASGIGQSSPTSIPITNPTLVNIAPGGTELLAAGLGSQDRPLWSVPLNGAAPRALGEITALDAAWSPGRNSLAFTRENELFLSNGDGSAPRRIAQVSGTPRWPRWSPDGSRIRFSVFQSKSRQSVIWEIRPDGSALRELLPGWNPSPSECCGAWTPDGQQYLFESNRSGVSSIWALPEKTTWFSARSPEPIQLTTGPMECHSPTPAPDSHSLFLVGIHRRRELVRHHPPSAQFVPQFSSSLAEGGEFSPDAKWFAYRSYPDGILWRSRADGSEPLQISSPTSRAAHPLWSPDGKWLLTVLLPSRLAIFPATGGPPQFPTGAQTDGCFPSWSPDGESIMFSDCINASSGKGIRILELKSKQLRSLPGSSHLYWSRWSPSGRYVAAITQDNTKLVLFDFQTGTWRDWVDRQAVWPIWSRKDDALFFSTLSGADAAVMRIGVSEKLPVPVASLNSLRRPGEGGLWLGLTPDDVPLVLRDAGSQEIYSLRWREK